MNKYDKAHLTNLNKYSNQVERIYEEAVQKAALWSVDLGGFDRKRPLTLDDYPIEERKAAKLLEWLRNGLISAITTAAKREWELSNAKNDDLCFMFRDKDGKLPRKYADPNSDALAAFLKRKRNGLKLSDRVWSYTERFREEIELGLDLGIRTGRSAAEISRDMRLFLKRPDILHRRIRTDMVDDDGNPVWKMSKAAAAYSPGRGVYRSSAANARRLAVTECNMAYRASDHERWQQLDFVAGQHVILSKRHGGGDADVCDDLSGRDENDSRGRYPKEFKFLGWHPQCRCFVVPILCDIEEMERMRDAVMEGRDYEPHVDKVEEMPKEFGEWMERNAESIERARARGNVPYFLADNEKLVGRKSMGKIEGMRRKEGVKNADIKRLPKVNMKGTLNGSVKTEEKRSKKDDDSISAIDEIGILIGAERGLPMSVSEADKGSTNLHAVHQYVPYKKKEGGGVRWRDNRSYNHKKHYQYRVNCQTCAPTYKLREWGYNVVAKGNTKEPDNLSFELSKDWSDVWRNSDGSKVHIIDIATWGEKKGNVIKKMYDSKGTFKGAAVCMYKQDYINYINETCKKDGTYQIGLSKKSGRGHTAILKRIDGKVYYIEPQTYEEGTPTLKPIEDLIKDATRAVFKGIDDGIIYLDDKRLNPKYASIFEVVKHS